MASKIPVFSWQWLDQEGLQLVVRVRGEGGRREVLTKRDGGGDGVKEISREEAKKVTKGVFEKVQERQRKDGRVEGDHEEGQEETGRKV